MYFHDSIANGKKQTVANRIFNLLRFCLNDESIKLSDVQTQTMNFLTKTQQTVSISILSRLQNV